MTEMKKIVLLYNFSGERLAGVKKALVSVKAMPKEVAKADYGEKLGYLAEITGYTAGGTAADDFDEEMLVMCGFQRRDLEILLMTLRKYVSGGVALKVMITETNAAWNSCELYHAVKADHEEMQRNRPQE